MINEEGGIDPEQFRMEAMFDRMDAIGKGILGLTIQCAQCHNHKFDPLTQEEYYRLFAFLNNDDEAEHRGLHARASRCSIAEVLRSIRDDRRRSCSIALPTGGSGWTPWEEHVAQRSTALDRAAADHRRRYRPAARSTMHAQKTARCWPRAMRRPSTRQVARQDRPAARSRAFRLELLTDPNLPLSGPGRSIIGTCALSEFAVDAAPTDAEQEERVKLVERHGRLQSPETPLEANFDDK